MKTLEVTAEQYAYIQHLREQISEEVVGKYGFVRERDAVQFLIDNLDDDLEFDGEFDAAIDVSEPIGESDDGNAITYDEEEDAIGSDDSEDGSEDLESEDDGEEEETASDGDEDEEGEDEDAVTESEAGEEEGSDSGDEESGAATDDDMLDRMMNLLETHDDKWEESPSADYRYRVTLPDGTTTDVQTKDDVRAALFKNYR